MKKLILRLCLLLLPFLLVILYVNFVLDPYSTVYYSEERETGFTINRRVSKMRHILSHKEKYDIILWGSSRSGAMYIQNVSDCSAYNMAYAGGTINDFYENIKTVSAAGKMPSQILLTFDSGSLNRSTGGTGYLKNYPVDGNMLRFYYEQLEETDYLALIKARISFDLNRNEQHAYIVQPNATQIKVDGNGNYVATYADAFIDENPAEHSAREFFIPGKIGTGNPCDMDFVMDELTEIKRLCDGAGTVLTVVVLPNHIAEYVERNPYNVQAFLREAVNITEVYSFAGINSLTKNNLLWYERSHFRIPVGDMILDTVLNGAAVSPELKEAGFGVVVTKENVNSVIELLNAQLDEYAQTGIAN